MHYKSTISPPSIAKIDRSSPILGFKMPCPFADTGEVVVDKTDVALENGGICVRLRVGAALVSTIIPDTLDDGVEVEDVDVVLIVVKGAEEVEGEEAGDADDAEDDADDDADDDVAEEVTDVEVVVVVVVADTGLAETQEQTAWASVRTCNAVPPQAPATQLSAALRTDEARSALVHRQG